MFTDRVVLPFAEIEGVIGDNLPRTATHDSEWWKNSRSTVQGRAWIDVGWNVESVDMNNRTVRLIRVAKPETRPKNKAREKKKAESYRRPLRPVRRKKPALPSKTRISKVQARLKNIERRKTAGYQPAKSAYEKRLFRPSARPSKNPD